MSATMRRGPLGRLMLAARTAQGLSLRGLSVRLDAAPAHISNVERGRVMPSAEMLARICKALGVPERDRDPWYAAAEMLAPGMLDTLLAHPERWGDVRAQLAGAATERDALTALRIVAMEYLDAESARDEAHVARADAAVYGTPDNVRDAEHAYGVAVQRVMAARKALRALTSGEALARMEATGG